MTREIKLTDKWAEVATSPALLEATDGTILLHFGTAAPAADSTAFHRLGAGWPRSLTYSGNQKTYARTSKSGAALIVSELA